MNSFHKSWVGWLLLLLLLLLLWLVLLLLLLLLLLGYGATCLLERFVFSCYGYPRLPAATMTRGSSSVAAARASKERNIKASRNSKSRNSGADAPESDRDTVPDASPSKNRDKSPSKSPKANARRISVKNLSRSVKNRSFAKHKVVVSEAFKNEAARIRHLLKEREEAARKASRGLLNPDDSHVLSGWDAMTTLALAFTALVTPFEIGFFPSESPGWDMTSTERGWFAVNRVVDAIFVSDIFLQFRIMYPAPTQTGGSRVHHVASGERSDESTLPSDKHVRQWRLGADTPHVVSKKSQILYVASSRKIAVRYVLSAWFVLDFVSLLPSIAEIVLKSIMHSRRSGSRDKGTNMIVMLRMVRVARLAKLVRLVKYKRIVLSHSLGPHRTPPHPHSSIALDFRARRRPTTLLLGLDT
jgi:hypothetical protein